MGEFETLDLQVRDRAAQVVFTRPERMNSLSAQAITDLAAVVARVRDDPSIRALVFRGSGGFFSVGLDADLLDRGVGDHDYFATEITRLGEVLLELEALEVPTVAVVNGLARAGGFELVLACDLVLIDEGTRIGDVHTSFGMAPGGGSSVRLPRIVGVARAKEIVFTARWLSGTEAADIGLALSAHPADGLDAAADALVASLTDKARSTLGTAKRMIERSLVLPTREGVLVEREEFLALLNAKDSDAVEGFRAWQEKRSPSWA